MSTEWADYRDFYTNGPYAPHLRECRLGGPAAAVQLLDIGQPPGDWSDPAVPDLIILQNFTEGARAHFNLGGGRFGTRVPKGALAIVPPHTETEIVADDAHEIRVVAIPAEYLTPLMLEAGRSGELFDFGRLHSSFLRSEVISEALLRMWDAAASALPVSRLAMDGAVLTLLSELIAAAERPQSTARGGLAAWQIRWVREHMEAHIGDDVSLATLADLVDLSPNHFCSAFKTSTGEPPHRSFVRMRIERAKEMLSERQVPVTQIALDLGFGSSAHFSTVFRKHVGMTPTEFRRNVVDSPVRSQMDRSCERRTRS
jgi:AraC family transcriptional regulator